MGLEKFNPALAILAAVAIVIAVAIPNLPDIGTIYVTVRDRPI